MRLVASIALLCVAGCSFADQVKLIGCEWEIPERFAARGEHTWRSTSGEMSIIFYKDDFFKREFIENSLVKSIRHQKLSFYKKDNGYEMAAYTEYLVNNENVVFPSWVVIKSESKKGVFYLNGLEPNEIISFAKPCMPNLELTKKE